MKTTTLLKQYFVFSLFFFLLTPVYGEHQFDQFNTNDGLSNNSVSAIIQDQFGFLWLGTYNGLNRYDGYQFKKFPVDPRSAKALSSKTIYALCEDQEGFIWIGTNAGGVNKYDQNQEIFIKYLHNPDDPQSICSNTIRAIYEDRDGDLWFGTIDGLSKYNRQNDSFQKCDLPLIGDNRSFNRITEIYEDYNNILWIGTVGGLFYEDQRDSVFAPQLFEAGSYSYKTMNSVHGLIEDESHNLWFGTFGYGLFRVDKSRQRVT